MDVIIDRADPQASHSKPARIGPAVRHGLGDDRLRNPVKSEAGTTATGEEVVVAAAKKIEPQIERGVAKPSKYRARHQAIAATVNHPHPAANFLCRIKL